MPEPAADPIRSCIACRNRASQSALIRVRPDWAARLMFSKASSGRSAYVCASVECIDKVAKSSQLARAMRKQVSREDQDWIVDALRSELR
ncbi:MAG: YlxR family protein [Chthonomonas sp.]|nr:YlxR family protein [Chthonomonas sp.]